MTPPVAVSTAGIQTLGAPMTIEVARQAETLGFSSLWVAEANAAEAMSVLGGVAVAAPRLGLATGVVAIQLRTPPLAAMAAATLQQLAPDRDVLLGIGISSPVVAGRWHGADYTDRPLRQIREYVALVQECLSGEAVTFDGDFYAIKKFRLGLRLGERRPKIVLGALNEQMLRLGGEIADGVLLNYLPASHVPWSIEQVRRGGDAHIYAFVHCAVTDRDRHVELARRDLFSYAVVPAYAQSFTRAGYGEEVDELNQAHSARDRDRAIAAVSPRWVDEIQIMGDAEHVRGAIEQYRSHGVETPIVFALPWGEDRRQVITDTLEATSPQPSMQLGGYPGE